MRVTLYRRGFRLWGLIIVANFLIHIAKALLLLGTMLQAMVKVMGNAAQWLQLQAARKMMDL